MPAGISRTCNLPRIIFFFPSWGTTITTRRRGDYNRGKRNETRSFAPFVSSFVCAEWCGASRRQLFFHAPEDVYTTSWEFERARRRHAKLLFRKIRPLVAGARRRTAPADDAEVAGSSHASLHTRRGGALRHGVACAGS